MAIGFNASGDYAKRTGSPCFSMTGSGEMVTIAAWIYMRDVTPDAYAYPFGLENADSLSSAWVLIGNAWYGSVNHPQLSATGAGDDWNTAPSQDTWYYFYITGENDGTYIDWNAGYYTVAGSSPTDTVSCLNDTAFDVVRVSLGNDSYDEWFDCIVAHARVWTGVILSDSELRAERDSYYAVRTSGLWADWPLTINTDGNDHSGNGRTLTLGGTLTTESGPLSAGALSIAVTPGDPSYYKGGPVIIGG